MAPVTDCRNDNCNSKVRRVPTCSQSYSTAATRMAPLAIAAFQASMVIIATPPVLVEEEVTAAAEPEEEVAAVVEPEEEVVPAAATEEEESDSDLETLLEDDAIKLPDELIIPVGPVLIGVAGRIVLDAPVPVTVDKAATALALEAESELATESLLTLLEALILLIASATELAAVPLAVKGVAEPERQVVKSKPTLRPVRPLS